MTATGEDISYPMTISNNGILTLSDFSKLYSYREIWVQANSSSFLNDTFWSHAQNPVFKFEIIPASVSYANFPPSFNIAPQSQ